MTSDKGWFDEDEIYYNEEGLPVVVSDNKKYENIKKPELGPEIDDWAVN